MMRRTWIGFGTVILLGLATLTSQVLAQVRVACGLVTLDVLPKGATTLLDGEILGENIWLISVLPGNHTVEVRKSGFKSFSRDFDLPSGARMKFSVNLERGNP